MPFATVRIVPGVKIEQTPTLLQASLVASNCIRWRGGLPEKLGGWVQFLTGAVAGICRHLWPWADFRFNNYLAVATTETLSVYWGENVQDITPQYNQSNAVPNFTTTAGSSLVLVTDSISKATIYDGVVIANHVAVGGLIIYGEYSVVSAPSSSTYVIDAGANATASVTSGGVLATFTVINAQNFISVSLANHGLSAGNAFPLAMPVVFSTAGITLQAGFYDVLSVTDANTFTIAAAQQATTGQTVTDNGGDVQITYWVAPVPPPAAAGGWGLGGGWGDGGWGTALPAPANSGTKVTVNDWTIYNFSEDLISNPVNGPLFDWDVDSGLRGSRIVPNGPTACAGFFIAMPQQQIVAYGCSSLINNGSTFKDSLVQDPMQIRWCDNGDFTTWVASATNQAGSFRLPRGSRIIYGMQAPQQALLWTDLGLWLMQYVGYPDVWGFFEIAQQCGPIGKNAIAVVGPSVFWMGLDSFWMYAAGGAAQRINCDVWDIAFPASARINMDFLENVRAAGNTSYNEVAWHFPSAASVSGENDTYVKLNVLTGEWDYGSLTVTEWVDNNVFGSPLSAQIDLSGSSALIMQNETSRDANGQPLAYSYKTGFFALAEGEEKVFVDYMLPDFTWRLQGQPQTTSAQVALTLYSQDDPDNPTSPPAAYGPYYVTNATGGIEPRARGRYFSIQVAGSDLGSFTRLGGIRFRFSPDGRN